MDVGGGLIYSGQLLLELTAKGVLRETAYRWVQRNALEAWEQDGDFRKLVEQDRDIAAALAPADYEKAFSLENQLRHVDAIFERVFGG
jgi:adenylosuccinate lyase